MKIRLIVGMALGALLLFSGAAMAKDTAETVQGALVGPGKGFVRLLDSLDLSAAQKHQVAAILKDARDKSQPLRDSLKASFAKLREIMDKTPGDEAAVRQAAKIMSDAAVELAVERGKVKAALDALLTPEQRSKRDALRTEFKQKFLEHKENRHQEIDAWIERNL
ncbi:Spy/CpxP family protein refolding chaperone [Solidesulfovibrio alcoholivorans]|uniref:Spy/CpxP family protein refolding chaperone n=1 Tax=Solidesulfovibrio alcoholivorans TaxID=81406 RepID=UPI000497CFAA|nr:Spy/CpxP family protein refolding chaperone [Solidesulfovibrio alcoholivorans]